MASDLLEAGRQALARAAPDTAIQLLRRALEEGAPAPPRAMVLLELGRAEMAVRDPAAISRLQEAYELASGDLRGRVAILLSEILIASGNWEEGFAVIDRARVESGEPAVVAELETIRAVATAYDPRLVQEFDRQLAQVETLSKGDSWAAHALAAVLAAVTALRSEPPEVVRAHIDRALDGGRLLKERGGGAWAAGQVLWALLAIDDEERGRAACEEALEHGRRAGSLLGLVSGAGFRGAFVSRRGDLRGAEVELRRLLDLAADTGMAMWLTSIFHVYCDVILERPQVADVADLIRGYDLEPVFLNTSAGSQLLETRARVALLAGDRTQALADLEACAGSNHALQMGPTYSPWRSVFALALAPSDRERADALVAEELRLARRSGLPRPEAVALRAAGMLAGGEEGVDLLRASRTKLHGSPARLEDARSAVELGAALRRGNHRKEAREHLEYGMGLADDCGAERLLARAEAELRAAGARPRRTARSGVAALTVSELRVSRLAASGQTNPEIAQALFVTPKTVETHLSSAYRKLGLGGQGARAALAERLASDASST